MEIDYAFIGKRIRKYRRARNLSQEKLAEMVYISPVHMSHIETGSTKLSLQVFVDLARALEVSTDDLLGDIDAGRNVSITEIADVLADCTTRQVQVISEIVKSTKQAMDKYVLG